jgi:chromosomal replication initiator protein
VYAKPIPREDGADLLRKENGEMRVEAQRLKDRIAQLESDVAKLTLALADATDIKNAIEISESLGVVGPPANSLPLSIAGVKTAVCIAFDVQIAALEGEAKAHKFSHPRYAAFKILRENTGMSMPQIARHFGGRDHTTVMHGLKRADELYDTKPYWRVRYEAAKAGVRGAK